MYNSLSTPYDLDTCKILVLGDSGVGKTSLTHLICHNEVLENPKWTIGALVDVKIHIHKEGTPSSKNYFMEFWDVGGSTAYKNNRSIFYSGFYGVILVYDLTNYKSYYNLTRWIDELQSYQQSNLHNENLVESLFIQNTPTLVVATKVDSLYAGQSFKSKRLSTVDDLGAEEIKLDNKNVKYFAPGQANTVRFSRFFDKVINNKIASGSQQQNYPTYPRNLYE